MYKEVSKSHVNSALALALTVALIFIVMTVSNNFIYPHNKMLADTVNMLFFGFSVYFFMRFQVTAFEYKIENNTLNKNNPQLLMSVTMLDIENFGKYDREKAQGTSVLNYCGEIKRANRYSFNVTINEKRYTVVFQPSEILIKMLDEVTA